MSVAEVRWNGDSLRTRLGTLILIRWLAIAGQSTTVLVVQLSSGGLAVLPVAATIGASVLLNCLLSLQGTAFRRLGQTSAFWHIAFDVLQLGVLLGLTGGTGNPFCIFIVGPVALAAATLPGRPAAQVAILAGVAMSVVTRWHRPLPWPEQFVIPPLYTFGSWSALSLGIAFVAFFTWRMAAEARRIDAAYEASRTALLQEQRIAAVGELAAMVAHELNTPLGTVCLVAREVAAQMRQDDPNLAEMRTLVGQAERCRDILARLTRRGEREAMVGDEKVPFSSLVEMAAAPHKDSRIDLVFTTAPPAAGVSPAEPWILRSPEILHGVGNLLQNAVQFARRRVEVRIGWTGDQVTVRIHDDGPGFDEHLLDRLGEPYLSTRDHDGAHLGLGIFIAKTLLTRTGASLLFSNDPMGGGIVTICWRRAEPFTGGGGADG